jgi:hypothetical protein
MRQLSKFAVVCACGLTMLAAGACAQMGMGMRPSMPSGVFTPTVGAGAAYEVTSSDGKTQPIEFAIVGKESVNGKDGYWMEWTTSTGRTGPMIMKTLIVPGATDAPTRMIMQMGSGQPMEMPTQGRMGAQAKPNTDIREGGQDVGKESVTVPAGTFSCEHYRSKDGGDVWISSQVPLFGMVKSVNNGSTMVLTKAITGAKDKITGTPVPFNPQMMMQGTQNP